VSETAADRVRALESLVKDPRLGLPEEVFLLVSRLTPLVNVDLLIQDESLGTLLTWRDEGSPPTGWHVPGGVVRYQETFASRICLTARNELLAEVEFDPSPLAVNELIHPQHHSRGHHISFLFRCRLTTPLDEGRRWRPERPLPDFWKWHREFPADMLPVHEIYRSFFRR
jgi:colanic acid biosynthesis protein WcaH